MQEEVKLITAQEYSSGKKMQFLIFMREEQKLGQGGFGVVRKAIKSDQSNQVLAVKIIPYQDDKKRNKIQKQINIIKNLPNNPNLVGVLPYKFYSNNNYYIFMQYCSGGTLEDLRKEKKNNFTQNQIFDIFYQLMNGYKVLWQAKILHHDLKLQNVLIKDGKYKLSDFGFSIFYQGVKLGSIREGTLIYMPLQMLTQKQYYATQKSDVYSMGIMLFKLITGHHPYVQARTKDTKLFIKQLKINQLYLRPNFSKHFSIKYQHFFDLILKMISKNANSRITFTQVYQYIKNEQYFNDIKIKLSKKDDKIQKIQYQKLIISSQSSAIAIHLDIPKPQSTNIQSIQQQSLLLDDNNNQSNLLQSDKIQQINKYIISHRILVYYFDRLTRRIYIEKMKKIQNESITSSQCQMIQKLTMGLLLFCKKIIHNLLTQSKQGNIFPRNSWRVYVKNNTQLINMIHQDEQYLDDLIMDCQKQCPQVKSKEQKYLVDRSKIKQFKEFKQTIIQFLKELLKSKGSMLNPDDKQNLITICYIKSGIEILENYQEYEKNAIELEKYFRSVETEDVESLFTKVTTIFTDQHIEFALNLSLDQYDN